jgi:hypothetical protein
MLIFFDRRFIRRYTKEWVPPVITIRRWFLLLTLIHSARRRQRPSAAFALATGDSWRRARAACSAEPPSIPRARRRPPRLSTALIRARRCRHPPRVWPPPRFPTKRRHLGSPAFTGGCARLQSSSTAVHRRPFLRCGEAFTVSPLPLQLGLHCTVSRISLHYSLQ